MSKNKQLTQRQRDKLINECHYMLLMKRYYGNTDILLTYNKIILRDLETAHDSLKFSLRAIEFGIFICLMFLAYLIF